MSPHPEPPSVFPPHPIPLGCLRTRDLSALLHASSNLHWSSILHIHVSVLFSPIVPPSPSPTECKSLFFTSVSLLLSCLWGRLYCLSKFHIYALIYCIGVSLSDFSLCIIGFSFIHFIKTDSNVFFFYRWVISHCAYVPRLPYPFVCQWTSRLLPCPSYCK